MRSYDRRYAPPAPVAEVAVGHPVSGVRSGVVRGKLDTGAGLTVLPQSLLVPLGLSAHRIVWARTYDGTYSRRPVYYVSLVLEGNELPVVECLAAVRESVLVGRNVLNRFVLTLDGGRLQFEIKPVTSGSANT